MGASIARKEQAFWADSLGGSDFSLDGETYTNQATVARDIVSAGDKVLVCPTVDGNGRRQMLILDSRGSSGRRRLTYTPFKSVALGDWLYALGGSGLSRGTTSSVPTPDAVASILWTGTDVPSSYPLGVLSLSAGAKLITAQMLRDEEDTIWEKLRLSVITETTDELEVNLTASPSLILGFQGLWSNSTGDLVICWLEPEQQVYRKRFSLFEALTISSISQNSLAGMNVVNGVLGLGRHVRQFPTTSGGPNWYSGTLVATYGSVVPTDGGMIEGWNLDVSGTTISRAFSVDPVDILELVHPVLFSWYWGQMAGLANNFVGVAAGREALHAPDASSWELCILSGGGNGPVSNEAVISTRAGKFSTAVKASIFSVDSEGGIVWQDDLSLTASAPTADGGLLNPLTDFLASQLPTTSTLGTGSSTFTLDWGGRIADSSVAASSCIYANYPYGGGRTDDFNLPQYSYFVRAGIHFLPQAGGNTIQSVKVGTQFSTVEVFTGWPVDQTSGTEQMPECEGMLCTYGDFVFTARLEPEGLLISGGSCDGMGDGMQGQPFPVVTYVRGEVIPGDPEADPPVPTVQHATIYHVPDLVHVYRRYIRKSGPDGGVDCDLTQMLTAAWYRTSVQLKPPFGTGAEDPIGGNSADEIPMADNIWKMAVAGRVLWALTDWHTLGAKFLPETRLTMIDHSDMSVLRHLNLRLNNDLLTHDIHESSSSSSTFTGDGVTEDFELDDAASSITEVRVNGIVTASWTWSSDHPFTLHFTDTPEVDDEIEVDYQFDGALLYREGDYKYEVDGAATEIRCGSSGGTEWALIFVTQKDRTTGLGAPRVHKIEGVSNLATAPTVTVVDVSYQRPNSLAISNGHILQAVYESGSWQIQQV